MCMKSLIPSFALWRYDWHMSKINEGDEVWSFESVHIFGVKFKGTRSLQVSFSLKITNEIIFIFELYVFK